MEICTTLGEVNMNDLRKEVRELITINEKSRVLCCMEIA